MLETKAGPKTTEFWVIIFTNLAGVLQLSGVGLDVVTHSQNKYVVIALAAVNGLYAVGRGLAKQGIPAGTGSPAPLRDPYLDDPGSTVLAPEDLPTGSDQPSGIAKLAVGGSSGFTGTSTSSAGGTPVVAHTRRSTDPKPVKPAPKPVKPAPKPAAKKPAPKAAPKPKGKGTA